MSREMGCYGGFPKMATGGRTNRFTNCIAKWQMGAWEIRSLHAWLGQSLNGDYFLHWQIQAFHQV